MAQISLDVTTKINTKEGTFYLDVFTNNETKEEIVAIRTENVSEGALVRLHSKCYTGDVLHSLHCDCYEQLTLAKEIINENQNGVILYLDQEGRGIGLVNKLKAYNLQQVGFDTLDANLELGFEGDLRDYTFAVDVLKHYDIKNVKLMTNNQLKIDAVEREFNVQRYALIVEANKNNESYLQTKKERMGHLL